MLSAETIFGPLRTVAWNLFQAWWWVIIPGFFYFPARFFYQWWLNWHIWYPEQEWMVLEIVPPAEIIKPYQAMEDIFNALWPIHDIPIWREAWCWGELFCGPFWFSIEIVSLGGDIHFYFRILREQRNMFEAILHTHYPELEIFEVPDYTQNVPQDLPNEKYDLYGEDFRFIKGDFYPIKTYKYFEIRPGEKGEEKRLDPFVALMEAMAKLKKGEQYWFQIIPAPILNSDIPWVDQGRERANKIAKRPSKPRAKGFLRMFLEELLGWGRAFGRVATGRSVEELEEEVAAERALPVGATETGEREMLITPGERAILTALEEKISKYGFKTSMRGIYIYEKGCEIVASHRRLARTYFMHFATQDLNTITYVRETRCRVHYFFRKRRLYARKRGIFTRYVRRFPPFFPKRKGLGNMIFNAEELATIFRFPSKAAILPPGVPRIPAKKGGPPPNLPTE